MASKSLEDLSYQDILAHHVSADTDKDRVFEGQDWLFEDYPRWDHFEWEFWGFYGGSQIPDSKSTAKVLTYLTIYKNVTAVSVFSLKAKDWLQLKYQHVIDEYFLRIESQSHKTELSNCSSKFWAVLSTIWKYQDPTWALDGIPPP